MPEIVTRLREADKLLHEAQKDNGIPLKLLKCENERYVYRRGQIDLKTALVYIASWPGMVILAIINGLIREKVYGPSMSELSAHQLSSFIAIILFGLYIYVLTGLFAIKSAGQAWMIGGIWLVMTIIFEFLFGHYVAGHAWSKLLHDYNLLQGRVWLLVLAWTTVAPYLFYRLRS